MRREEGREAGRKGGRTGGWKGGKERKREGGKEGVRRKEGGGREKGWDVLSDLHVWICKVAN